MQHACLYVQGQAGGEAVAVVLCLVQPFGLKEDMVALPIGEAGNLVLNRRAVAGACALDDAGKERGSLKAFPDDGGCMLIGVGHVAGLLRQGRLRPAEAELGQGIV